MINHQNLIPECHVDTAFVEMLGYKNPNHAPGITEVSSILKKEKAKVRVIGFIDDDKKKPQFVKEFKCIKNFGNIKVLKHPTHKKFLVVVYPAMDKFIFDLSRSLDIKLNDYHLPTELGAFIRFTKQPSIIKDKNFKNLLNTIKQKKPTEVVRIISWIADNY